MSARAVTDSATRGRPNSGPRGVEPPGRGRVRLWRFVAIASLLILPVAHAVLNGPEWEAKASRDPDLVAATAAIGEENWREAGNSLTRYVERRPWDDDGLTMLGYAYRKMGAYDRSVEHYERALKLNPYHLGAMEYLGEAYLETGDRDSARALLGRLETACRQTHGEAKWRDDCEEWQELTEHLRTEQ